MRPAWDLSDFSAILASRSGAPVASDARAHVASRRDEDAFCVVASSTAEVGLIPPRPSRHNYKTLVVAVAAETETERGRRRERDISRPRRGKLEAGCSRRTRTSCTVLELDDSSLRDQLVHVNEVGHATRLDGRPGGSPGARTNSSVEGDYCRCASQALYDCLFVWRWLIVNDRKFLAEILFFSRTN